MRAPVDPLEQEGRRHEDSDRRGEVRQVGQPEQLRQHGVHVDRVVTLGEQRDAERRQRRPEHRGRDRERAAAAAVADRPDGHEPDRQQQQVLADDDQRQCVEHVGAADEACGNCQQRPAVADRRRRQLAFAEEPARRVVVRVVAALVPEPAVVLGAQRDAADDEPLDDDERSEQERGPRECPARPLS